MGGQFQRGGGAVSPNAPHKVLGAPTWSMLRYEWVWYKERERFSTPTEPR